MTPALRNFIFAGLFLFLLIILIGVQKKSRASRAQAKAALEQLHEDPASSPVAPSLHREEGARSSQAVHAPRASRDAPCVEELPLSSLTQAGRDEEPSKKSHKPWSIQHQPLEGERELRDLTPLLFQVYGPHLPIVERIRYSSRVDWIKDRPAWVVDYAAHFGTSKHFISRSLTRKRNYTHDQIAEGEKFTVLNPQKDFEFALVVSLQEGKMRFYYFDLAKQRYVLLKHYLVYLGQIDPLSSSGSKTPLGKYLLGSRIASYRPGLFDYYKGSKVEMISVFGSRWIPFQEELARCSADAKGYGIHGVPWKAKGDGTWYEDDEQLGKYQSDGCIRMCSEDVEELFSIIITRRATIEIVKDFSHAADHYPEMEPEILE